MAYKKILVAVDTSDEADAVMAAAKEMTGDETAGISLVTVIKPLTGFYVDMYATLGDIGGIESQAVAHATNFLSELADRHGVKAEAVKVIIGAPAVEIRELAEEMAADLIVMGTHGQHGLGLMLGSTANAVLHGVSCNVLAVKIRKA